MTATVQSIDRAFSILQIISDNPSGIGVSAIANQANLHISTVSRILTTLEQVKAVRRPPNSNQVSLGEGLISMSNKAPWSERLVAGVKPFLKRLAQQTGEAVGLTLCDDDQSYVLIQIQGEHHVQIKDWTGVTFPLHVTSSGKLYLAHLAPAKLEYWLEAPLSPLATATITDPQQLRTDIEQVRQQSFAWTVDELEDGLATIAAPIYDAQQQFVAGIYISAPAFRYADQAARQRLTIQVVEASQEISHHIHHFGRQSQ